MAITLVTQVNIERRQFVDVFHEIVEFEAHFDIPNLNSNGFYTEDATIPGLLGGDIVIGISLEEDIQNLEITAHVKAVDTLSLHVKNNTAGAINLPESHLHIIIGRPTHLHAHS